MTAMLGRINGPAEVETALAGGIDILELPPDAGPQTVRDTVVAVAGRCAVQARTSLPADDLLLACGVEGLTVSLPEHADVAALAARTRLTAVLPATPPPDPAVLARLAAAGCHGAMLEARAGRLLQQAELAVIRRFIALCHQHGLSAGLAGGLELPDVPRLLVLVPDVLGFDAALRDATGALSPAALQRARGLIPGPGSTDPEAETAATDCIFLHDFVLPARIGVYAHERQAPQTIRCNVDAFITRLARPVTEMRDVVTYDMIGDAIRLLIDAGHIDFLETLAERLAARLLAHPRVVRVAIRLEKLELGAGIVGVAIERSAN
jgi:dihydroneopterin aldolase